jgi:hypothetical protein
MPKLPQLNIRLPTELHDLVRELAQRLRADPSLAVGLESLLAQAREGGSPEGSPIALGLADEVADLRVRIALLPEILDRLTRAEETAQRVMTFAETLNAGLVEVRQAMATTPPDPASPAAITGASPVLGKPRAKRKPAQVEASNSPIPIEHLEAAARLWDGGNGLSIRKIIESKGWPYHRSSLARAVKRYLDESAQPQSVEAANERPTSSPA